MTKQERERNAKLVLELHAKGHPTMLIVARTGFSRYFVWSTLREIKNPKRKFKA